LFITIKRVKNIAPVILVLIGLYRQHGQINNHIRTWIITFIGQLTNTLLLISAGAPRSRTLPRSITDDQLRKSFPSFSEGKESQNDDGDSSRRAPGGPTQRVDHADAAHVELEEGVVDGLPPLVVHEEVVEHGAQLGRQACQEMHHAQPRDADLRPGDVDRQQHQEAHQRDA